jgi:hypothetical protein
MRLVCPNPDPNKGNIMDDTSSRSVTKRPIKDSKKRRSTKRRMERKDWELEDERLDDALRQTFPASDALSIIQNVRGR